MIKLINKMTNKILKRELIFSDEIPFLYLLQVMIQRTMMYLRGFRIGFFLKKKGSPFFVGKKVSIKCKHKISIGNCVSFQDYVIIDALSKDGMEFGNNVSIGVRSMIKTSGSLTKIGKGLKIGNNTAMGNDCFIGAAGGVIIGNSVAIGQNVRFHSENHEFRDKNKLISEQGVTNVGIFVGDDVWIGAGAVLLDGVHVGKGCVIGANSLVNKSVPEYAIAVGNPVRIVGFRGTNVQKIEK